MVSGAPQQSRWIVPQPCPSLRVRDLPRLLRRSLGERRVLDVQPLADGFRNANFKILTCPMTQLGN